MTNTNTEAFLRPLSIPELLDRSIRLYRRHFLTFIGILAVVQIPLTLISLVISLFTFGPALERLNTANNTLGGDPTTLFGADYFLGLAASIFVGLLSLLLIRGLATAATARAVSESYLGQPVSFVSAYQNIPSIGAVLRAALYGTGVILVCLIWTIVPCVGWFTGPGLMAFASTCISIAMPIVVLEGLGAQASMRRAWDLARQRFWPVWWFVVALYLFNLLVVSGPSALVTWLIQITVAPNLNDLGNFTMFQTIIETVINLILSLLYGPLQIIAMTLLYFDLRVRYEGLDLSVQAATASGATALAAAGQAPRQATGSLITSTEIGNFVALTFLFIVVYFAFIALGVGGAALLGGF